MLIRLILGQIKEMEDSGQLIFENLIKLTRSSENKFKRGNFKGALDDKMKANAILKSKFCDKKMIQKYRKELSSLYSSKFDLIFDHKLKIDEIKINEIVKILERKSEEKLKNLDFRGAIKALRRAEKYISI
jgi:flagellin-specific chaperone FliS